MTVLRVVLLVVAGLAGGAVGAVAGLASVVTYPSLLALGLPPVVANVTNTVSLVFSTGGAVSAARPELRGQGVRLRRLAPAAALGGALGGAILLVTPRATFEFVVPWLVALGAAAMLARGRLTTAAGPGRSGDGRGLVVLTAVVGVYSGYFGAGAGVMLLALFLHRTGEGLARANGLKNAILGVANGVAAASFALFGPVRWWVVPPFGLGLFVGGRLGTVAVRRLPADALRVGVGIAGLALAARLAWVAYR